LIDTEFNQHERISLSLPHTIPLSLSLGCSAYLLLGWFPLAHLLIYIFNLRLAVQFCMVYHRDWQTILLRCTSISCFQSTI